MKSFRKTISIILSVVIAMQLGICAFAGSDYTIVNPYEDVIWSGENAWGAYKGSLHTHTTYSDADDTLPVMVKESYNQDYDFLAISDHGTTGVDWNKAPAIQPLYLYQYLIDNPFAHLTDEEYEQIKNGTYPLYDGTIRNKKLVPVLGANEFNHFSLTKNHVNGYFLEGTTGSGYAGMENEFGYEQVIKFIDENGGLSHINHPGDWLESNADPDVVNDEENIKFFGDLILKYDSCLGIETLNERNGTTGYDRILWDNLLMYCLRYGKTVMGYSNSDAHRTGTVDSSFMYFMMEENNPENIKKTMQTGAFFSITRKLRKNDKIGPAEDIDVINKGFNPPMFTSISVDGHKVTVTAKDSKTLQWIANGKVVYDTEIGTEPVTIDLDAIKGEEDYQYIRAELFGEGGLCHTQAFVIDDGSEPLKFEEEKDIVKDILNFIKATKAWTIVSELIRLIENELK